jgi:hypothetical protein
MSITTLVQTELNESGAGVFWPVQQVYDAINETLLEFDSVAYFPIVTTSMTFTQGADLVPWPNTILMWPHYLEFNGRQYFVCKQADLERWDRNWRNCTQAQPEYFVLWDEQHLRPYPYADQTYVFNIWGPGWQPEISSANTDIAATTPPLLAHAILHRSAARLFAATRPDLAKAELQEAEYYEQLYRIQWRRNQGDNTKRLRPGTAYNVAQGGNIRIGRRIDGQGWNPYR